MSHYFADVKAAIVDILRTQCLTPKHVYDYEESQPVGYPAVTVTPTDGNGTFIDTMRNRREFVFKVLCTQERIDMGPAEAERILTKVVDEVLAVFESQAANNLNNTVVFTDPPKVKWGYMTVPDAEVRSCEITITAIAAQ